MKPSFRSSAALSRNSLWPRLNRVAIVALFFSVVCGCARELQHSTLSVAATVDSILETSVLENLGRFAAVPYAMPSQIVLSSGVVTVQNQLTTTAKLPYTGTLKSSKEVDIGGTLQWQGAWTIQPVTDPQDLARLQYLYRGAVLQNIEPPKDDSNKPASYLHHYLQILPRNDGSVGLAPPATKPQDNQFDFGDQKNIDALLSKANSWIEIDGSSHPSSAAERKQLLTLSRARAASISDDPCPPKKDDNLDPFIDKGSFNGHRIAVRQCEFARFMMFILYATPNSNDNAKKDKGIALAL